MGVHVSIETVRRLTEGAGAAQVAVEQAAIEQVRQALPPVPAGPEIQQISADGAMAVCQAAEYTDTVCNLIFWGWNRYMSRMLRPTLLLVVVVAGLGGIPRGCFGVV
jgi:hypothetical protein